jgi:hypothetical protein
LLAAALGAGAAAQTAPQEPATAPPATAPAMTEPAPAQPWTFAVTAYTYRTPEGDDYVQTSFLADRGWLHLEARHNYEDLDTGSLWLGRNFTFGEELQLEITPMVGAVFGQTQGVAPGYRGTLTWGPFDLYSEGEYLLDTEDATDSFFYSWSELAWSPTDWLRVGIVAQRTRAYETDLDVQRGLLLGLSFEHLDLTAHLFNLDESEPTFVFSFGIRF